MNNYERTVKKYGISHVDGKEYALTQDAYADGGAFVDNKGCRHDGNWYAAAAIDKSGKEYQLYWTDVDWETDDIKFACDWDNADYVCET